ncbi:uncharacterized protein LOC133176619 [Saccostrea echinata]|uniref:uncharacterized protein LOC133176619 n=1 Tax=Saccostrea echinata TaxID=191078 RepID=UPI002A820A5D|nr:uncharacterized protein LOC133176619 [Saccostrea echinata]
MERNFSQNRHYVQHVHNDSQQFPHARRMDFMNPSMQNQSPSRTGNRFLLHEPGYPQARGSGPNQYMYPHGNAEQGGNMVPPQQVYSHRVGVNNPRAGVPMNNQPSPHEINQGQQDYGNFNQNRRPQNQTSNFPRGRGTAARAHSLDPGGNAFQPQKFQSNIINQKPGSAHLLKNPSHSTEGFPIPPQQSTETGRSQYSRAGRIYKDHSDVESNWQNQGSNSQITEKEGKSNIKLPSEKRNVSASSAKNKKFKKCILSECHNSVINMRDHMLKCHLPKIFNVNLPLDKPALNELRMQALTELTSSILGTTANIEDLCDFLRMQNVIPTTVPVEGKTEDTMRAFCRHHGYNEPKAFLVHTINSPAVLLHWKAMSYILQYITPTQQEEFHKLFHAEGLEFEWEMLKNKKLKQEKDQRSNEVNIHHQSSDNLERIGNVEPKFDVPLSQLLVNQIVPSSPENQSDSGFGQSRKNDNEHADLTNQGTKKEKLDQELEFSTNIPQEEVRDLQMELGSVHSSNFKSNEEDQLQNGSTAQSGDANGLIRSQRRRRKRTQNQKNRKERKTRRKITRKREARRIDRQIKRLNARIGCPVPGCFATTDLKLHAYKYHLPKIFDLDLPNSDSDLQSMRWLTLRDLTFYILGVDAHVEDLLEFMRTKNVLPQEVKITPSLEIAMRALCQHQGLEIPMQFTLWPPNSPAILLHWRALLGLLQYVSPQLRDQFKSAFAKATVGGLSLQDVHSLGHKGLHLLKDVEETASHVKMEREEGNFTGNISFDESPQNFSENLYFGTERPDIYQEDRDYIPSHQEQHEQFHRQTPPEDIDRQYMVGPDRPYEEIYMPERLSLMDSHFYFGRLCMLFDVRDISPSGLLSNLAVHAQPKVPADIIGGVMVYSNPKSFSLSNFPNYPGWRNCFGVDALASPNLLQEEFEAISVLTNSADAALGDIGLDRSAHKESWVEQELTFRQLLTLSTPAQPMILKVTGPQGDPYSLDVSSRVRDLVRRQCSPDQHIHICNFRGEALMVKEWLEDFPNCFFGFSRKVLEFDEQQVKGLQAVPDDRLLLESDVSLPGVQQNILENSPLFLGEVASAVATIRNDTLENIAHKTVSNTCRLYNL